MRRQISNPNLLSMQMTDARTGVMVNAEKGADGIWLVRDSAGFLEIAKGVTAMIDGWLVVRLVDSFNKNPSDPTAAMVWTPVPVFEKQPLGYVFDAINVTQSTATLFSVTNVGGVDRPNLIVGL